MAERTSRKQNGEKTQAGGGRQVAAEEENAGRCSNV